MIASFIKGILSYFNALGFILSNGLGKYFIYSGLIGLCLFAVSGYAIYSGAPFLSDWLMSIIPWNIDLSLTVTNWISIVFSSVLFLTVFKYLMLIFTAPLMSALSAKVEQELTGDHYAGAGSVNILKEIFRSFRINFRNIIRELILTAILLGVGLLPLVGIVSGLLIILVQSYYAGFGNYDFWAERHFSFRDTVRYMKQRKGSLSGNGIVYVFLLAIPVLGAFLAPPLATVAATMVGTREMSYLDEGMV